MDRKKEQVIKMRQGFIAALDQSGGSSGKTLALYGVEKDRYKDDKEMFDLIHKFRKRIMTSSVFSKEEIIGVILFQETMNRKIDKKFVADYLWDEKNIVSFLKVDKGLLDVENGVQLMKPNPELLNILDEAKDKNIFGTKMRSVIHEANKKGIEEVVRQQFTLAKTIFDAGLVPIIEPEVNIASPDKEQIEIILKEAIDKELENLDDSMKVIFKFSLPSKDNFYSDYLTNPKVLKVVALSGGYTRSEACEILSRNNGVVASFSRALLEDLEEKQSKEEFDNTLKNNIRQIYEASVK